MRDSLAPSSRKVLLAVAKGRLTAAEIRDATGLPRRIVYTAVRRLIQAGLLQERPSLRDTRQSYYSLAPLEVEVN